MAWINCIHCGAKVTVQQGAKAPICPSCRKRASGCDKCGSYEARTYASDHGQHLHHQCADCGHWLYRTPAEPVETYKKRTRYPYA